MTDVASFVCIRFRPIRRGELDGPEFLHTIRELPDPVPAHSRVA